LGFENFEPKKIPENFDPGRSGHGRFTTGELVGCLTDTFFSNFRAKIFWIFQLSIQKFSGFSNFEPKKFRPEKMWSAKFSDRPCRARSVVRELVAVGAFRRWSESLPGFFPVLM